MGQIIKGANGGFSGKAGSVIGANWRSIDYIRGLARRSNKPATEKQLEQKLRFSLLVSFLAPLKSVMEDSYRSQDITRLTGYNLGFHFNLFKSKAITGVYPDFAIDYSKIEISRGSLMKPVGLTAKSLAPGEVTLSWSGLVNGANAFATDKAMVVLYDTTQKFHVLSLGEATRADKTLSIQLPEELSNDTVEVFMFFTSEDGKTNSPTSYGRNVVIL